MKFFATYPRFCIKIFGVYTELFYFCDIKITVGIAQLVRALDCGSRGRGFEPHYLPEKLLRNEELFTFMRISNARKTEKWGSYRKFGGNRFLSIQFHHSVQEECCVPNATEDASESFEFCIE